MNRLISFVVAGAISVFLSACASQAGRSQSVAEKGEGGGRFMQVVVNKTNEVVFQADTLDNATCKQRAQTTAYNSEASIRCSGQSAASQLPYKVQGRESVNAPVISLHFRTEELCKRGTNTLLNVAGANSLIKPCTR
jgi:hypothetical protein